LLVSVAAASPPAHANEKLASTFDEAYCDVDDSGECADEPTQSAVMPPVILGCESPFIQEMIGSCDMPKQAPPTVRAPTLHNAAAVTIDARGDNGRVHVISAPPSVDSALPPRPSRLHPLSHASPVITLVDGLRDDVAPSRLDRPPRV
jgi:hypothetical protein